MSTFPESNSKPTLEQVQAFDRDHLLAWVTVQCLTLRDDNLEKFRTANIVGSVFLECDYDSFRKEVGLDFGTAKALDILVKRIKGSKNEGLKSKFHLLHRKHHAGNKLTVSQGTANKPSLHCHPTLPPRKCFWTARSRLNGLLFTSARHPWASMYTRQLATIRTFS
jgi:hypothetical protein